MHGFILALCAEGPIAMSTPSFQVLGSLTEGASVALGTQQIPGFGHRKCKRSSEHLVVPEKKDALGKG